MSDAMHAAYANNDALAAEVQRLRAALAAATADRLGTHWAGCWRDGGRRHWQCAVAEAERQAACADAAERATDDLHVMLSCLPEYMRYCNDTDGPALSLAEWWAAQPGMDESETQP